jgi:hypothetical protein
MGQGPGIGWCERVDPPSPNPEVDPILAKTKKWLAVIPGGIVFAQPLSSPPKGDQNERDSDPLLHERRMRPGFAKIDCYLLRAPI